jgi:hypothetical protein
MTPTPGAGRGRAAGQRSGSPSRAMRYCRVREESRGRASPHVRSPQTRRPRAQWIRSAWRDALGSTRAGVLVTGTVAGGRGGSAGRKCWQRKRVAGDDFDSPWAKDGRDSDNVAVVWTGWTQALLRRLV